MTQVHAKLSGPVMIAAGGTGGHLFPGQALAEELQRRGHSIVLVTDERVQRFDNLFPGADVFAVPAATFGGGGLVGFFRSIVKIISGTTQSLDVLARAKPSVVIGFGGYPTMPPMLAALAKRVPVIVHEQNAVLGRVNKFVAPFVKAVASTFPAPKYLKARDAHKLVLTGNPVRDMVLAVADRAYQAIGADGDIRLCVFGGSQGARVMSDIVPGAIADLPATMRARLKIVQQCREEDIERVRATYRAAGIEVQLSAFFDNMPEEIAQSHLVIGRAGASTISELAVIGRPSILVPLPHSLDQDQKANAEMLSRTGAVWMIEQSDFTSPAVTRLLAELFGAPDRLSDAAAKAKAEGRPDAVKRLADLVERVARGEDTKLIASGKEGAFRGTESSAAGKGQDV
ncbi:MAG: undecaprenyldiphospho-muramoylpentapeptide beta-N-acetylglucosaminyltransferase [Parvibaculum sp.]